jgi:hypothetical protein
VPRCPGAALLLAVVCLGAWTPPAAPQLVRYNGELRVDSRASAPEQSDPTYLVGTTARINMESFIWKPWFASIGGTLDTSRIHTFAESDSQTQVLSGDARLRLFPASRFPTFGFVSVTDTRTDVESSTIPERQVRVTRFGLSQSYQPESGRAFVSGLLDRSIEEGTEDRLRAVIDRVTLNGSLITERQRFGGDFNVRRLTRELNQEELFELVGTFRHNARPVDTVTVDSFATYTDTRSETSLSDLSNRVIQANSLAVWRPRRVPLTMSGTARVIARQQERDGSGDDSTTTNLAVGGDYLINRRTRLSANVTANITDENANSTQGATLSYNPDPFPLGSFTYNWITSTTVFNQLGAEAGDRAELGALFSHNLTRARPLAGAPAWTLSIAGNNNISGRVNSVDGSSATLGLNGSIGMSHARASGSTSLRLDANDSRTYGTSGALATGDNNFQSINFNLSHRQALSNNSQWNAYIATGWNRQDFGGEANTTEFSNLNVAYSNARFLGVRRMLFRSQLTARTVDLLFGDLATEENSDMRWENRVDYTIGKLEMRLIATLSRVNARNGYTVVFSIARKFDGAF